MAENQLSFAINGKKYVPPSSDAPAYWSGGGWLRTSYEIASAEETPPTSLWQNNYITFSSVAEAEATLNFPESITSGMWVFRNTSSFPINVLAGDFSWVIQASQRMLVVLDPTDGVIVQVLDFPYNRTVSTPGGNSSSFERNLANPNAQDRVIFATTTSADFTATPIGADWVAGDTVTLVKTTAPNDVHFAADVTVGGVVTNPFTFSGIDESYTFMWTGTTWRIAAAYIPPAA